MMTGPAATAPGYRAAGAPKYALIPVHGYDITVATVARMLDDEGGTGTMARTLHSGEPVPLGAQPVLVASSTVYGAVCVEHMLRAWHIGVPRPWLVLVADAPAPPPAPARYRLRALQSRLLGIARVPYLPVLRTVEGPEQAISYQDVIRAAAKLRRQLQGK